MLLVPILCIPSLLLRYLIFRKPFNWGMAGGISFLILLGGLLVISTSDTVSKVAVPASAAMSFAILISKKRE